MQLAQGLKEGIQKSLQQTGEVGAGFVRADEQALPLIVGRIINGMLGIVGILFVVLMVYAGFLYMTSRGDEQQVTKAKKLIIEAVIGLGITLSAYAITTFVVSNLVTATTS